MPPWDTDDDFFRDFPGQHLKINILPTATLVLAALLAPGTALAQTSLNSNAQAQVPARNPITAQQQSEALGEGMGVLDRARPEYDAAGLALDAFTLYPTLAVSAGVDDNIFRAPTATASALFIVSPRLDLRGSWDEDTLQLFTQLDHYAYADRDTESRTNWMLGAAGRKDLGAGAFLGGNGYYFDTHENRTSPDLSLLALSPTRYQRLHADGALSRQLSLWTLSAAFNYDRFDFDQTQLTIGGPIDNGDRDRNAYQFTGRAGYEVSTGQTVFAQVTYDPRDFDRLLDRNGVNRSSDGYRLDLGASLMITPVIRAEGYVGLLQQNHAAPLTDTSTFDFNLTLDWFATELLTGHLYAARLIDDTTVAGASSIDVRRVGASLDYELLREVILQPYIRYDDAKFAGIARTDRTFAAGLEGRYLLNQYVAAYAGYAFEQRDTNAAGRNFTSNVFTFGLRAQL
jgi:hypothetical protein